MDGLTINEASETTGWSSRMLRYIEREGLIAPRRSPSGYRLYGAEDKLQNSHFPREGHDYGPSKRMAAYAFLIRHLELDGERPWKPDGVVDESFVTVESREQMLVFGPDNPYPKDAVAPNTPLP